jgi:glutamate-1-semialdehyde 2,1-aminomutase
MLEQGIYLPPSQFEACFISSAHNEQDIADTLNAVEIALDAAYSNKRGE